jgi:hypothetical protein
MELCLGGELFDKISEVGKLRVILGNFPEQDAL